jgi:acylphosphatase
MTTVARRLLIKGRVQGVFYRAWSSEQAKSLGLAGWLRNRGDGSVEMLIGGDSAAVQQMIELCRQGPEAARVDEVDIEETSEATPEGFATLPSA